MTPLAMAPPLGLGGKLVVSLLMLFLAGALLRVSRGVSMKAESVGPAVLACFAIVVTLEAVLPSRFDGPFHDRGVLAGVLGVVAAAVFLRDGSRRAGTLPGRGRVARLCGGAFAAGPAVGLSLAGLLVVLTDVHPADRTDTFVVFGTLGVFAGLVGAGLVAVVLSSPDRGERGRDGDGDGSAAGTEE